DAATGARLLIKRLVVEGRWAGSLTRVLDTDEFARLAHLARDLLDRSGDELLGAKLECACAFDLTRRAPVNSASRLAELLRPVEAARELFAQRADAEGESEARDAIGAIQRGAGDFASATATQRERIAGSDRLGLLERIDAWSTCAWDLVFCGRFDEAIQMFDGARRALRPGEPEYMLSHAASWAA